MKPIKFKPFFNKKTQKSLLTFFSSPLGEIIKLTSIIAIVILLSYGITRADDLNPFAPSIEEATTNFSVIGTVSIVDDTRLILINAKGSDDTGEQEYNLNIKHLETIETSSYQSLSLEDVHIGDTVIAQGVTTGSVFFIKRLISFSSAPLPEQTATTTPEVATSTEDIATSTDDTATTTEESSPSDTSDTSSPQEEQSTTTPELPTPILSATTTEPTPIITDTPTDDTSATTTVIDTVSDILESGIDAVSNTFTNIIQNLSQSTPEEPTPTPEPEQIPPPTQEEPQTESPPAQ